MNNDNIEKKTYSTKIILVLFFIFVAAGKIIRYTLMKTSLVDTGIGHFLINPILNNPIKFKLIEQDSMVSYAGVNTISIFSLINIFKLTTYTGWEIYISLIWNLILFGIIGNIKEKLDFKQFIFIVLSVMVLNIFDFTLAKEPIQMLYFIVIYCILCSNKIKYKYLFTVLTILFSAVTFRSYFILIIMFMMLASTLCNIFIIKKDKVRIKNIIFLVFCVTFFYFIFLNIAKVSMPSQFNELIRVRTRTSEAVTDMRNIFKSSNLAIFSIDYMIMLIRMLVPVELVRFGPKYFAYIFYQLVITFFIVKALKYVKYNSRQKNVALFLYIGYLFASATFEPDFGSWVRHETVLFPIMLIISDIKVFNSSKGEFVNEKDDD